MFSLDASFLFCTSNLSIYVAWRRLTEMMQPGAICCRSLSAVVRFRQASALACLSALPILCVIAPAGVWVKALSPNGHFSYSSRCFGRDRVRPAHVFRRGVFQGTLLAPVRPLRQVVRPAGPKDPQNALECSAWNFWAGDLPEVPGGNPVYAWARTQFCGISGFS